MKKVFLSIIGLSIFGLTLALNSANATSTTSVSASITNEIKASDSWSYHTTVSRLTRFSKNFTTNKNCKCEVQGNGSSYRIQYNGNYYNVSTSNKEGYSHMFYADHCWYFNM